MKALTSKSSILTAASPEPIGKTVGQRRVENPIRKSSAADQERTRRWREAFPTPGVPKGVYRFKTFEEADEWMWNAITRKT